MESNVQYGRYTPLNESGFACFFAALGVNILPLSHLVNNPPALFIGISNGHTPPGASESDVAAGITLVDPQKGQTPAVSRASYMLSPAQLLHIIDFFLAPQSKLCLLSAERKSISDTDSS